MIDTFKVTATRRKQTRISRQTEEKVQLSQCRKVYGLLRSNKQVSIRLKARTYIRLSGGDAIS